MELTNSIASSGVIDSLTDPEKLKKIGAGLSSSALQSTSQDFESLLYSLLLKEMRTTSDSSGEGGLFAGDKSDALGGMFDLFMSQHLASSGSLGIAKSIESYLANRPTDSTLDDPALAEAKLGDEP